MFGVPSGKPRFETRCVTQAPNKRGHISYTVTLYSNSMAWYSVIASGPSPCLPLSPCLCLPHLGSCQPVRLPVCLPLPVISRVGCTWRGCHKAWLPSLLILSPLLPGQPRAFWFPLDSATPAHLTPFSLHPTHMYHVILIY